MNVLDVDASGSVALGIPTDVIEAATDGFMVFGTELNGHLLLSAPAGAISVGESFAALFGDWTVNDALASPVDFLLDPMVQSVVLSSFPEMGAIVPLEIEVFSFGEETELAASFGDGTITEAIDGDFDMDGDVDRIDYETWVSNFGNGPYAVFQDGDANYDGEIDAADYTIWRDNLTFTGASAQTFGNDAVVPEPGSLQLIVLLSLAVVCFNGRSSPQCGWYRHSSAFAPGTPHL